jgi:hypothetical protein
VFKYELLWLASASDEPQLCQMPGYGDPFPSSWPSVCVSLNLTCQQILLCRTGEYTAIWRRWCDLASTQQYPLLSGGFWMASCLGRCVAVATLQSKVPRFMQCMFCCTGARLKASLAERNHEVQYCLVDVPCHWCPFFTAFRSCKISKKTWSTWTMEVCAVDSLSLLP